MKKEKIELTTKILNHLTKHGKKIKSEKILLQSIKSLQQNLKKQSKKITQLAVVLSSPVFKFAVTTKKKHKKKKNKITPTFVTNGQIRNSLAIRLIIKETRTSRTLHFYQTLSQNIIKTCNLTGSIINEINAAKKKILLNKRLFKYYK